MNPFKAVAGAASGVAGAAKKAMPLAPYAGAGAAMAAPFTGYQIAQNFQYQDKPQGQPQTNVGVQGPAPAPMARVGVQAPMAPAQAPAAAPALPFPIMGEVGDHTQLRTTILGDLQSQMAKAQQAGDHETLYDLAAQRGALDNGGFQGLANYRNEVATSKAQRELLGRKNDEPRLGSMSPDEAWQYTLIQTKDERAADAAAQRARIQQNQAQAKASGQPVRVDANDAAAVLAMHYPGVANAFSPSEDGAKPAFADLYQALTEQNVAGMNDPNSEFAQAAGHAVRQLYGKELPAQVYQPMDSRTVQIGLPPGLGWMGPAVGNLFAPAGTKFVDPAEYAKQVAANQWWSTINAPPAP